MNKRNVTLHDNESIVTFSSDRDTQELFHEQSTSSKTRAGIPYPMGFLPKAHFKNKESSNYRSLAPEDCKAPGRM